MYLKIHSYLTVPRALCGYICALCPRYRGKASWASTGLLFWGYIGLLSAWSRVVLFAWQPVLNILALLLCRYAAFCVLIVHLGLCCVASGLLQWKGSLNVGRHCGRGAAASSGSSTAGRDGAESHRCERVHIFFLLIVLCVTLSTKYVIRGNLKSLNSCISELVLMLLLNQFMLGNAFLCNISPLP